MDLDFDPLFQSKIGLAILTIRHIHHCIQCFEEKKIGVKQKSHFGHYLQITNPFLATCSASGLDVLAAGWPD